MLSLLRRGGSGQRRRPFFRAGADRPSFCQKKPGQKSWGRPGREEEVRRGNTGGRGRRPPYEGHRTRRPLARALATRSQLSPYWEGEPGEPERASAFAGVSYVGPPRITKTGERLMRTCKRARKPVILTDQRCSRNRRTLGAGRSSTDEDHLGPKGRKTSSGWGLREMGGDGVQVRALPGWSWAARRSRVRGPGWRPAVRGRRFSRRTETGASETTAAGPERTQRRRTSRGEGGWPGLLLAPEADRTGEQMGRRSHRPGWPRFAGRAVFHAGGLRHEFRSASNVKSQPSKTPGEFLAPICGQGRPRGARLHGGGRPGAGAPAPVRPSQARREGRTAIEGR